MVLRHARPVYRPRFHKDFAVYRTFFVRPRPGLRRRCTDPRHQHVQLDEEGSTNVGGGQWSRSLVGPNANVHLNDSLADVEVVMGGQMLSRGAGERSARG